MENRPNPKRDQDRTGTTPAGGMQHGSSSGDGGNVGKPAGLDEDQGPGHHPRPDTPESKVEHQADQPGVTIEEVEQ